MFLIILLLSSCAKDVPTTLTDTPEQTEETDPSETSEEPSLAYLSTYGGSQDDSFRALAVTDDGGFIAVGHSQSTDGDISDNDSQQNDYWVVKMDLNGTIEWSKTYGGSDDDRATSVIQTNDGGYAIAGYARSDDGDATENAGFYDQWLLKLNPSGIIEWQKNYGFSGSDQSFSILQTTDGGYFASGFLDVTASEGQGNDGLQDAHTTDSKSTNNRHGVGEFWGHKLDAAGNLLWRRYFGGSNNDRAYAATETSDGGILMIGASESGDFDISNPKGSYDYWMVRLTSNGELLWEKSLGGSEIDIAYAVTRTQDGHYIIAGDTRSADGDVSSLKGNADIWMVKIDDTGSIIWEKTLGGTSFDTARGVAAYENGFVVAGASRSSDLDLSENKGQTDIWIVQTDLEGDLVWQSAFGGSDLDFGYAIAVDSTGRIVVVGDTQSNDGDIADTKGNSDAVLLVID